MEIRFREVNHTKKTPCRKCRISARQKPSYCLPLCPKASFGRSHPAALPPVPSLSSNTSVTPDMQPVPRHSFPTITLDPVKREGRISPKMDDLRRKRKAMILLLLRLGSRDSFTSGIADSLGQQVVSSLLATRLPLNTRATSVLV